MFSEETKRIANLWDDLVKDLKYNYRFFAESELLEEISNFILKRIKVIKQGSIFFRARIFNIRGDYKGEEPFWGYNSENSFVNKTPDYIGDGRANPYSVTYLYMAESVYTACAEVRPYLGDYISVAKIQVDKDLKIIDLSSTNMQGYTPEEYLACLIEQAFSKPIRSKGSNYLITQYISEYIKKRGFDGIRFKSSLDSNGINLTVFNYMKCHALASSVYRLDDWTMEFNIKQPTKLNSEVADEYIDLILEDGTVRSAVVIMEFFIAKYNKTYIIYHYPEEDIYEEIRNATKVTSMMGEVYVSSISESDSQPELHTIPNNEMKVINKAIHIIIIKLSKKSDVEDNEVEFLKEVGLKFIESQDDVSIDESVEAPSEESGSNIKDSTEEDSEFFTIYDGEGNEATFEILYEFDSDETGKHYIIYTDNEEDDERKCSICACIVTPDDMALKPLESKEDEQLIKRVINDLLEE